MNHTPTIIVVALATVTASLFGLVLLPDWQMGQLGQVEVVAADGSAVAYPQPLGEQQQEGRQVYKSLGCIYCHSQQVRPAGFGVDIQRGWGQRRSVPRDYIFQSPPLTGSMRTGPDLANIGLRQPSKEWHYLHLYDPQITSPGSIMPPMPFLFTVKEGPERPSADVAAIQLPEDYGDQPQWIIPTTQAEWLVTYLLSLQQPFDLEVVQ